MRQVIMHFRLSDENDRPASRGGLTVAICPITATPPGYTRPMIGVGAAFCHPKDNFSRVHGRERAVGRALKGAFRRPDDPRCLAAYPEELLSGNVISTFLYGLSNAPATWNPHFVEWVGGEEFRSIRRRISLVIRTQAQYMVDEQAEAAAL